MERQIYISASLFGRKQAAGWLRVVIGCSRAGQAAGHAGRLGAVNVIHQVLGGIQARATANRTTQGVIDRLGAGQFLLSGRPLNILAAMAVTQAHIHFMRLRIGITGNMVVLRMIVNVSQVAVTLTSSSPGKGLGCARLDREAGCPDGQGRVPGQNLARKINV